MRNLHIDGKVWRYAVGRAFVHVRSPDGVRLVVGHNVLTGLSWEELERAERKGTGQNSITPSMVREYVVQVAAF